MKIKTPKEYCFYPRSKNEPDRIQLWIPKEQYPQFFTDLKKRNEMKMYYPDGIEIDVTERGFAEFGIHLELKPDKLKKAFRDLVKKKMIPESRVVDGTNFKKDAQMLFEKVRTGRSVGKKTTKVVKEFKKLSEPKMTDGENAFSIFSKIR
jgi:hypothetical protein